jgi:hypothetical protein
MELKRRMRSAFEGLLLKSGLYIISGVTAPGYNEKYPFCRILFGQHVLDN